VLLSCLSRREGAEIAALSGLRTFLARIEPTLARFHFPNDDVLSQGKQRGPAGGTKAVWASSLACAAAASSPGLHGLSTAGSRPGRILAAHRGAAFPPPECADMGLALFFLLVGVPARFLALGLGKVSLVSLAALILGGAGLFERNRNRLAAAFDFAALSTAPALQFAVLELVHHAARGLSLTWSGVFGYDAILLVLS
jgi:hypothetical protein